MGFEETGRRCLPKCSVFCGRERPSAFQWLALLCLSALVLIPGAPALSTGLAKAGLLAIAVLTAPAPGVGERRI